MYEIWKVYVESYSSYRVRTKVLTKFSCDLDLWPFDPRIYRYFSLTILYLCMKYERCTLKVTQVIVSEPKFWQSSVVTLTFWPQNVWVSSSHHPASMYEIWKLYIENYSIYCVRTKVLTKFRCDLDLLIPKCIGIFLSPPCIYVWNMTAVRWKLGMHLGLNYWPSFINPEFYKTRRFCKSKSHK